MRSLAFALSLAVLLAPSLSAAAAEGATPKPTPMTTPFDADGYSVIANTSAEKCLVGSDINIKMMLAQYADLQKRGLVRPDVDASHVSAHAWSTASAVAFKIHPMLITMIFDGHPAIDRCAFVQTITGLDGKQTPAYGFSLTRSDYKRTDWSSVGPAELPKVTENFTVFKEAANHLSDENH